MSTSISELMKTLNESGLLTQDELDSIRLNVNTDRRLTTGDDFARELVKQEFLTKLQAAAVLQGKTQNLIFGDYVVLEKLGSGGMGQVFKARHKPSQKNVALKVLSADAVKNRRMVERFKKEARAVARLKHPNIVRAFEAGKINRIRYLVMEFVDGENLLNRVKRKGQLSVDECVSCVLQAARGLDYAHQKGIIHRDIKPSNFMRDRKGRVKILDMGLARVDEGEDEDDAMRLTVAGQMLGTARFMAPEQIEDARKSDVRSDIYSLGCTMYFLLRGKAPYSGETVAHTLMAHVSAPIPDLCKKRSDVPDWLGAVFQKMLAKKASERFQTMGELVIEIQHHLGEDLSRHEPEQDAHDEDYAREIGGSGDDEGASLEELFSEDEPGQQPVGEEFAEAPEADIPEVVDGDFTAAPVKKGFGRPAQSDEPIDEAQLALVAAADKPKKARKFAVNAATAAFKLESPEPEPDDANEPEALVVAPIREAPAETIADRMKSRHAQEAKSTRRLQIIGGVVVAVLAVIALGFMLAK